MKSCLIFRQARSARGGRRWFGALKIVKWRVIGRLTEDYFLIFMPPEKSKCLSANAYQPISSSGLVQSEVASAIATVQNVIDHNFPKVNRY